MAQGSLILPGTDEKQSGTSQQTAWGAENLRGGRKIPNQGTIPKHGHFGGGWAVGYRQLCNALGG